MGELGPRMVVVPFGGAKVPNCIPEKVCNETITDILRSMIDTPYAISKYEITFAEYDLFATVTGRELPEDNGWGRGTQPVIFVAWKDTLAYVNWLSEQTGFTYRLPTVIEWEHAARAGEHTAYWWGIGTSAQSSQLQRMHDPMERETSRTRWFLQPKSVGHPRHARKCQRVHPGLLDSEQAVQIGEEKTVLEVERTSVVQ